MDKSVSKVAAVNIYCGVSFQVDACISSKFKNYSGSGILKKVKKEISLES